MHSLRRNLLLGTTLGTAAAFVASGVALYLLVRASLTAQLDRSLCDKARLLASTIEQGPQGLDVEFEDLDMGEFQGARSAACLQVWSSDGATVYRSCQDADLATRPAAMDEPICGVVRLPDGRPGRAVFFRFLPRREQPVTATGDVPESAAIPPAPVALTLARSTEEIDRTLAAMLSLLVVVGAVAGMGAAAFLWWFVSRSLRPLEGLAMEIASLQPDDLGTIVRGDACPEEVQPVVGKLNDLLRRLEKAFQRERAMSANVAHELRNPLAGLRLKIDVATSRSRPPHEYQLALAECRQITAEMQQMVENLLSLARLEGGQIEPRFEPVAVGALIHAAWAPLESLAKERHLRVEQFVAPDVETMADRQLLEIALRNLLENAVSYADQGGEVKIRAALSGEKVEISVANSGSDLSQAEAENAFEPFWRNDAARSEAAVHCGLGLALARKIVTILHGNLSVESAKGGEFLIQATLPGKPAAPLPSVEGDDAVFNPARTG